MNFAPVIDPRLRASIGRIIDLRSSAAIWRELRRRTLRLGTTTPCYESVRKLVVAERERRARILAAITTAFEITTRRIPVLPEQVPRIYRRRLPRAVPPWVCADAAPHDLAYLRRRVVPVFTSLPIGQHRLTFFRDVSEQSCLAVSARPGKR